MLYPEKDFPHGSSSSSFSSSSAISSLPVSSDAFTSLALSLLSLLKDYTTQTSAALDTLTESGETEGPFLRAEGKADYFHDSGEDDEDDEDDYQQRQQYKWVWRRVHRLRALLQIIQETADKRTTANYSPRPRAEAFTPLLATTTPSTAVISTAATTINTSNMNTRIMEQKKQEDDEADGENGAVIGDGAGWRVSSVPSSDRIPSPSSPAVAATSAGTVGEAAASFSSSSFSSIPPLLVTFPPRELLVSYLSSISQGGMNKMLSQWRGWGIPPSAAFRGGFLAYLSLMRGGRDGGFKDKMMTRKESSFLFVAPPCEKYSTPISFPRIMWKLYRRNIRVAGRKRPRPPAPSLPPASSSSPFSPSSSSSAATTTTSVDPSPTSRGNDARAVNASSSSCSPAWGAASSSRFEWTSPPITAIIREEQQDWRMAVYTCQQFALLPLLMEEEGGGAGSVRGAEKGRRRVDGVISAAEEAPTLGGASTTAAGEGAELVTIEMPEKHKKNEKADAANSNVMDLKKDEEELEKQLLYCARRSLTTLNMVAEARFLQRFWMINTKAQLLIEWEPLEKAVRAMREELQSLLRSCSPSVVHPYTSPPLYATPALLESVCPYFYWQEVQHGIIRLSVQRGLTIDITFDIWKREWQLRRLQWSLFTFLPLWKEGEDGEVQNSFKNKRNDEAGVENEDVVKKEEEEGQEETARGGKEEGGEGWKALCDEVVLSQEDEGSSTTTTMMGENEDEQEAWYQDEEEEEEEKTRARKALYHHKHLQKTSISSAESADNVEGGVPPSSASFPSSSTRSLTPSLVPSFFSSASPSLLFRLQPDHQEEMCRFLNYHFKQGGIREGCLAANRLLLCVALDTLIALLQQVQRRVFPSTSRLLASRWKMDVIPGTHVLLHLGLPSSTLWCFETSLTNVRPKEVREDHTCTGRRTAAASPARLPCTTRWNPTAVGSFPEGRREEAAAIIAPPSSSSSFERTRRAEYTPIIDSRASESVEEVLHVKIFLAAGKVMVQHHWGTDLRTQCVEPLSKVSPSFDDTLRQLVQDFIPTHSHVMEEEEEETRVHIKSSMMLNNTQEHGTEKKVAEGRFPPAAPHSASPAAVDGARNGGGVPDEGEEKEEEGMILDAEQLIWELVRRRRNQKKEPERMCV